MEETDMKKTLAIVTLVLALGIVLPGMRVKAAPSEAKDEVIILDYGFSESGEYQVIDGHHRLVRIEKNDTTNVTTSAITPSQFKLPDDYAPQPIPIDGYIIQAGDCLYNIAKSYGVSLDDLIRMNPQLCSGDPSLIYPGEYVLFYEEMYTECPDCPGCILEKGKEISTSLDEYNALRENEE